MKGYDMKVLIFCAHADDEVIGMGGTIRKFASAGAEIRLVIFSEGAEGYASPEEKSLIVEKRDKEVRNICALLGIGEYFNLHGLDWNLKVNNETYRQVIHHIRQFRPDVIFTHARRDYNDHQSVSKAVEEGWFHASLECAMEQDPPFPMVPLYEFEVLTMMDQPDFIADITEELEYKLKAMECYGSQTGVVGSAGQMITGRAMLRGQQIGVKYGEAFHRSSYRPATVTDIRQFLS
jgi:LmbE family N-acetylglucosaminyl deacetylase